MMGCLDYDSGLAALGVASRHPRDGALPGGWFGFYDCVLTIDHTARKLIVSASGRPETQSRLRRIRAQERLRRILHLLSDGLNTPSPRRSRSGARPSSPNEQYDQGRISPPGAYGPGVHPPG